MATVTPPRRRSPSEYDQRVRSPLGRLRGVIRTYVGLEGALRLFFYVALWFWIGLAFDYGFFRLFGIDWVQQWPWAVRLVLLVAIGGLVLTVVSVKLFGRLFREFHDAALALVLERRFPKLLGDRLITAVELSDLKKAEEQGYSRAMVLETIHEAAERVEQVPVAQAFDWGRLVRRGAVVAVLTLGLYLVVGGVVLAVDVFRHAHAGRTGFGRFNEVAVIWFERDVLLQNTIWPRKAQLELVNFAGNEQRYGREMKIPPLRVRALEYVIADPKSPEGWRALTWGDLMRRQKELLGEADPLPQPFDLAPRDPAAGLTVDEIALQRRKFQVRIAPAGGSAPAKWTMADPAADGGWRPLLVSDLTADRLGGLNPPKWPAAVDAGGSVDAMETAVNTLNGGGGEAAADARVVLSRLERISDLGAALDKVDARAALPAMSRTMRRLDLPDIIYLTCNGEKTYLRNELRRGQDNEYVGNFGDLKESVGFTVQAEDYYTPRRYITLVPPPGLVSLGVRENRPAYLFYRPDDKTSLADLRGKKQPFEERDVLQAGSETSRIDLPAGTDVVLTAKSDKPLREAVLKAAKNIDELRIAVDQPAEGAPAFVVVKPAKAGEEIRQQLDLLPGGKGFSVQLPDVRRDLVFDFEFTDTDGVKGKRKVVVKPQDDTAPELTDVRVEVMRKVNIKAKDRDESYYMVTRKARIPLGAKIHDDHMLGDVRYRYTLTTTTKSDVNAVFTVPVLGLTAPAGGSNPFLAAVHLLGQDHDAQAYSPPLFGQNVRDAKDEFLPTETIKDLLGKAQKPPFRQLVHDFDLKPDVAERVQDDPLACDFPLWKLMPQVLEDNPPFYRMDLWLEATDTDADEQVGPDGAPRPHLTKSKETFSFLIVPESVLLSKIGEDEVKQYASLNKRYQELQEKSATLDTSIGNLDQPNTQVKDLLAPSTRAEQVNEVVDNTLATTREVYANYQRIVREEQLNVIRKEKIEQAQDKIVFPLHQIIENDFPAVLDANAKFRKTLDDKGLSDRDRIDASRTAGKDLSGRMAKLLADLNAVLEVMKGLEGIETLIERLRHVDEGVHNLEVTAKAIKEQLENAFFDEPTPKKP